LEVQVIPAGGTGGNTSGAIVDIEFGSVSEFQKRMLDMKAKLDFMGIFFKEVMVKDEDYGVIPGTNKPTLYKPGAEKLCELYGFAAIIKSREEEKNYDDGYYRAILTIQLVHRSTGTIVGEGVGECSSYESKYRFRWVSEYKVPSHISKEDLLFEEKDEWKDGVKTNNKYKQYRIPNDDLFSQWNTVLKMAHKRALTGVTLQCTRSSGIFMQDEAEMDEYAGVPEEDRKRTRGAQGRTANASNGKAAGGTTGGTSTGASVAGKNKALELTKQANGGSMDWKWLTDRAAEALNRTIGKVITDVKDAEWSTVVGYIETYISADNGETDDDNNIPPDLR
jgi:hypothetical protein